MGVAMDNMMKRLQQRRVTVTLTLAGVFILAAAATVEHETNMPWAPFWDDKLSWSACADCVLAGDSRVGNGLSPADMEDVSPGRRVRNFAFRACGYGARYLDAIERVLDPASRRPAIILGISPRSLTGRMTRQNDFVLNVDNPRLFSRRWEEIKWAFDRVPLNRALSPLWPDHAPPRSRITLYPNGWSACVMNPEAPEIGLKSYRKEFDRCNVDPAMIADTLAHVRSWTERGITVYGFRPPTTAQMVKLENELSGFDEAAFVNAFIEAGGVWLVVDQTGYHSYDSVHLRRDAARQLSRDMAAALIEAEANRGQSRIVVRCGFNPALAIAPK